jgi:NADH-quinone oxidoreductase subunit L
VGYCFFPSVSHAEFKWFPNAFISLALAALGIVAGWLLSAQLYTLRNPRLVGLTARHGFLRGGYRFLRNKYYLDDIYEDGVVYATAHPIARASNWFNQQVIDKVVNVVGLAGAAAGRWTNRWIDRGIVDNVVNGVGTVTEESGSALRPTQSGRVSQYAALFFGAAAVGALVLVLINT